MIDAVIRYRRRHAPHAPALCMAEGDVSFARLDADADAVASHLAGRLGPGVRAARIAVRNPALAWVAAAAAQRIGLAVGFAKSTPGSADFGADALVLTDAADAPADDRIVRLDPSYLTSPAGPAQTSAADVGQASREVLFDRPDGGVLRLSGDAVETRVGEVDWLVPTGDRLACLIGPETPFGLAVALRQWMKGGVICPPAPRAPLAGCGPNRRLDLIVLRPSNLAGLLEALPPDAAPRPGLRLVIYGGRTPRALTLAAHLRLAPEVVLVHGDDAQGLLAMGVDTVARQDDEIGPLAPWLDAGDAALEPGVALNADGIVVVSERAAA